MNIDNINKRLLKKIFNQIEKQRDLKIKDLLLINRLKK